MSARKPPAKAPVKAPAPAPPEAPAVEAQYLASPHLASPPAVPRYRVLSGGISTPGGAHYYGAVLTAEQIGDETRLAKLLRAGAIEEVLDGG